MKTIVWTGHRPPKLGGYNELTEEAHYLKKGLTVVLLELAEQFRGETLRHVTGGALGIDQWVAEQVIVLRDQGFDMKLHVEIPFEGFWERWPPSSQERLQAIIEKADSCIATLPEAMENAFQLRNEAMLAQIPPETVKGEHGLVIAVWDGSRGGTANCVWSARRMGLEVRVLTPIQVRELTGYEYVPF